MGLHGWQGYGHHPVSSLPAAAETKRLKLSPQYSSVSQVLSIVEDFIVEELVFYPSVEISSRYIYTFSCLNYHT